MQTINTDFLDLDASALAKMIRNQEISSLEATEKYIDHIKKMNPSINFLVEERFTLALEEAAAADRCIAEDKAVGRLFGVPISMKESFHVAGMQTTGGLLRRKGCRQVTDAEVVLKLKSEGAIILGKTNTPELCFCQETDNKLNGRTNNPRDLTRTVGGSSGGEAAIIAIGGAAAGLGSDIGGSIRFPSHFNGVIGFKSGRNQVSSNGSYPAEEIELQQRMLGIGPITKSVRDAKLLYSIIAKKEVKEKKFEEFTINILPKTDYPLSSEMVALLNSLCAMMTERYTIERVIPPFFNESAQLWQEIMSIDGAKGAGVEAFGNKPMQPIRSYVREMITGKADIHRYLSWALIGASLFAPSKRRVGDIKEFIDSGDDQLEDYLHNRIIILPVYHSAAPKHGVVYKEIFSIRKTFQKYMPYVAYANVWGLPALTIPVGVDFTGMPIAIQLISGNGNEDALFALGELIEGNYQSYVRAK